MKSNLLKKVIRGVTNIASLCGVLTHTPPQALICALRLSIFEQIFKIEKLVSK